MHFILVRQNSADDATFLDRTDVAKRIKANEEILFDYGKDYWKWNQNQNEGEGEGEDERENESEYEDESESESESENEYESE